MEKNILEIVKETEALLSASEILGQEAARVKALREKLEDQSLTISVIGQFKRGKSALVNALLGEDLLPVGIVPITSAVTEITYGQPSVAVKFSNGLVKPVEFSQLHEYINEQENPENRLGVSSVSLHTPAEFLKDGITFVDTPGVGSFHKHNSDAAYAFVKESDAVIFMLSVDSPINEIEIDFLKDTRDYAAKFFFAVNKIDTIGDEDLSKYVDYCRSLLTKLMDRPDITLFPISAKEGTGLEALTAAIKTDLRAKTREILEESARLKLRDMIICALAQIELYWKVLLMPPVILRESLESMEKALSDMRAEAMETVKTLDADKPYIIPGLSDTFIVKLNEFKQKLSLRVTDIFGMDYHYELTELNASDSSHKDSMTTADVLGKDYIAQTDALCHSLEATMKGVLMFRNDSTVEVVTRIYSLNHLTRTLRRMRDALANER